MRSKLAQFNVNASICSASGSGVHEQKQSSCLLKREANKSLEGVPKNYTQLLKDLWIKFPFKSDVKITRGCIRQHIVLSWYMCTSNPDVVGNTPIPDINADRVTH